MGGGRGVGDKREEVLTFSGKEGGRSRNYSLVNVTPILVGKIIERIFFLRSFFKICLFLRERGREQVGEGQRETGRQNPKQAPHCQPEPNAELKLTNHEIMT